MHVGQFHRVDSSTEKILSLDHAISGPRPRKIPFSSALRSLDCLAMLESGIGREHNVVRISQRILLDHDGDRRFALSLMDYSSLIIRDIDAVSDLRPVEELQKEVWGCSDLDVVPLTMLVATREIGAVLVGAYDSRSLVGFVYGIPGFEHGQSVHHSHMLAVKPEYRNFNLGFKLKAAQRERVMAQGIKRVTWTFDPLQSLNAYFNFSKLGVIADTYKINFYGETTSSFLHQIGTDRLWVSWLVDSDRVCKKLENQAQTSTGEDMPSLVQVGVGLRPERNEKSELLEGDRVSIEIPDDINALQSQSPELAVHWREATRWAFTEAIAGGYIVKDFYRLRRRDYSVGVYVLSKSQGRNSINGS